MIKFFLRGTETTMSDNSAEYLSCLVDNELDARGSRFLVRRLSGDRSLQATWRRYHLVRACLHGEETSAVDLSRKVATALDTDDPLNVRLHRAGWWLKPLAGGAVAAAVAVVAVVGLMRQQVEIEPSVGDTLVAESGFTSQPTVLDRQFTEPAVPVGYAETRPSPNRAEPDRVRINSYVLRHSQAAGGAGSTGFVSYVPIMTERPALQPAMESAAERTAAESPESDE